VLGLSFGGLEPELKSSRLFPPPVTGPLGVFFSVDRPDDPPAVPEDPPDFLVVIGVSIPQRPDTPTATRPSAAPLERVCRPLGLCCSEHGDRKGGVAIVRNLLWQTCRALSDTEIDALYRLADKMKVGIVLWQDTPVPSKSASIWAARAGRPATSPGSSGR
jgi:hypothetical protein